MRLPDFARRYIWLLVIRGTMTPWPGTTFGLRSLAGPFLHSKDNEGLPLFGVVLPDYLLTCAVAVLERQPRLLLLGVFFPFMRMLDAGIGLYAIPAAWLSRSSGRWKSPARRAVEPADPVAAPGPDPESVVPRLETTEVPVNTLNPPARVAEASHVPG